MMIKRLLLGVIVLCLIAQTPTASAHTVLISSTPAIGATIKELPSKITLRFADRLLTLGKRVINRVTVTNSRNSIITSKREVTQGFTLSNVLNHKSPHLGIYTVIYRVAAEDGHLVTGSYTFTLKN